MLGWMAHLLARMAQILKEELLRICLLDRMWRWRITTTCNETFLVFHLIFEMHALRYNKVGFGLIPRRIARCRTGKHHAIKAFDFFS